MSLYSDRLSVSSFAFTRTGPQLQRPAAFGGVHALTREPRTVPPHPHRRVPLKQDPNRHNFRVSLYQCSPGVFPHPCPPAAREALSKPLPRPQPRYYLDCGDPNYLIFAPRTKRSGAQPPPRCRYLPPGDARERFASTIFSLSRKIRCVVRARIAPLVPREEMSPAL